MRLILPAAEFEDSYGAYIRELGTESRHPFTLDFEHRDFPALLRRLANLSKGIDLPEGLVPNTTFWLVEANELLGVSNLRHELNDRIREHGGHIGMSIRPMHRGRGLGRELLALTILEARKLGIGTVHVHCLKANTASARMILGNGGRLDSDAVFEGHSIQRFVIEER
jgi:predicted acetyltransferase